jgi:hypothetical protein
MRHGALVPGSLPPLGEIWELAQAHLRALPEQWRALKVDEVYPVRFSEAIQTLRAEAIQEATAQNPGADPTAGEARERQRESGK